MEVSGVAPNVVDMSRETPQVYVCELCNKTVSRLFGVGAQVQLTDGRVQVKTAVLGFCAAHRDQVIPSWLASLSKEGRAELFGEPVGLRPKEGSVFLAHVTRELALAAGGYSTIDREGSAPSQCPHCGADLRWGDGPHSHDERVVAGDAHAWECTGCGAAGLLGVGL